MKQGNFFPYDWNLVNTDDEDLDHTLIRVYGLNENNETISVIIRDFQPWVYVELPNYFREQHATALKNAILEKMKPDQHPTSIRLCLKKKLYGADFDYKGNRKLFPFLKVTFKTPTHIRALGKMIRFAKHWPGLGNIHLKMHEDNAHPVLQLCCEQDVPVCGWISFEGIQKKKRKETRCELEYEVSYKNLKTNTDIHIVPNPMIMAYDLEVYSSVRGSMPKHFRPKDEIFQISVIVGRQGSGEYESLLLTLGEPDPDKTGEEVEIRMFDTEADLIIGFTQCVQEFQPNVITGYNIFEFDIDYMIKRSKFRSCFYDFAKQGLNGSGLDTEKTIEWGSSAFKNQKFLYLHAEGRLFVDLLPVVRRDYKFSTYKLKEIATAFLGETKDPLTPDGIFQNYRIGMRGANSKDARLKSMASRALAVVGKYCVQDSVLVYKLFEKIQTWVGLTEMARICNTQIFFLFTQGQQIKVFSQVYKKCLEDNYIVERDGFQAGENESYTGAHVFEPLAGVHDWVVPLDFTSLYPTIIIAYNICWSTWVKDGSNIPDEDCHIFEWHDHFSCEHDTVKRSTKKVICEPRYYRFLKKPKGVLPTLLENLLDARNGVKGQIKETGKEKASNPEKEVELETKLVVLDKRQLALKVSANSMYGIMGVRKGYLPFMPGAMCVTAKGRESIIKVSKLATEKFGLIRIYGDTDSNYLQFPGLDDPNVIWDRAIEVAAEISKEFPSPMKLLFEMTIYKRFMILTKKRYMSIECDRNGVEKPGISKKGVMLARRDNSKAVRDIYAATVMDIFHKLPEKEVIENMVERIMKMCRGELPHKDFIITKRVGEISDYKIRPLPEDDEKRQTRLDSLGCVDEEDYKIKALPAQAQLLLKMQSRGENVGAGTRLEYVVTTTGGHKARQFVKIEDASYFMRHTSLLKIDYLYYVHNLSVQMDQVLQVVYGRKQFVKNLYKELLQTFNLKEKLISHVEQYFHNIEFKEGEPTEDKPSRTCKTFKETKSIKKITPKKKAIIIIEDE